MSQNVTAKARSFLPMSSNEHPANESDASAVGITTPCVELVPVSGPAQRSRSYRRGLPDSNFVTHLIATAEHAPQTRSLRRASLADARIAYKASQIPVGLAGIRMRQVI
jgi:hypothetical protein